MNNQIKYARKCDLTNKGMNEGYCINNGEMYIKEQSDMIAHLRELEKKGNPEYEQLVQEGRLTDDFLLNDYYESDYYYWTEWDDVDDDYHYLENGTYVETI